MSALRQSIGPTVESRSTKFALRAWLLLFLIAGGRTIWNEHSQKQQEIKNLTEENQRLIAENENLKQRRASVTEPSLKQRTLRLSNQMRTFAEDQSNLWNAQNFNFYPSNQQSNEKLNKERAEFDAKSSEYFVRTFDREISEIITEFQDAGAAVSVVTQLRAIIKGTIRDPTMVAPPAKWTYINTMVGALKELAGQIDDNGKLVR